MHIDSIETFVKETTKSLKTSAVELLNLENSNTNSITTSFWHLNGLLHHQLKMHEYYKSTAAEIAIRYNTTKCDVYYFSNQDYQKLFFEFYAFVNLTKISLDNLRYLLSDSFETPLVNIPKSFSDIYKGKTDHPSYCFLQKILEIGYLIDMRNCIAHYRTLATSDINMASLEGVEMPPEVRDLPIFKTFSKLNFRVERDKKIVINILLPDKIYEKEGQQKFVPEFSYVQKKNLIAYSNFILKAVLKAYEIGFHQIKGKKVKTYKYGI